MDIRGRLADIITKGQFSQVLKESAMLTERPGLGAMDRTTSTRTRLSMTYAFVLERKCSIFSETLLKLRQEMFRPGFEVLPNFAVKCNLCGNEMQEIKEQCDRCGSPQLRKPNTGELANWSRPDGTTFLQRANMNGQPLQSVLENFEDNLNKADNAFLLLIKRYFLDKDGNIEQAIPFEILSVDPRDAEKVFDEQGRLGGKIKICLAHRDKPQTCDAEKCPICGRKLYDVHYIVRGIGATEQYYIEGEMKHRSKYNPGLIYGFPEIFKMIDEAEAYMYMNQRIRAFYERGRAPGMMAIPALNGDTVKKQWEFTQAKLREDPYYIPFMAYDPQAKAAMQFVKMMEDPSGEMLEVKKELRERMSSRFGVSLIFQNDVAGGGGLNNESRQMVVLDRAVEWGQTIYNDDVLRWLFSQFNIKDWKIQTRSNRDAKRMAELAKMSTQADVMRKFFDMNFEVEWRDNDFKVVSNRPVKPSAPMPGMGIANAPLDQQMAPVGTSEAEDFSQVDPQASTMDDLLGSGAIEQDESGGVRVKCFRKVNCSPGYHSHPDYDNGKCHPMTQVHGRHSHSQPNEAQVPGAADNEAIKPVSEEDKAKAQFLTTITDYEKAYDKFNQNCFRISSGAVIPEDQFEFMRSRGLIDINKKGQLVITSKGVRFMRAAGVLPADKDPENRVRTRGPRAAGAPAPPAQPEPPKPADKPEPKPELPPEPPKGKPADWKDSDFGWFGRDEQVKKHADWISEIRKGTPDWDAGIAQWRKTAEAMTKDRPSSKPEDAGKTAEYVNQLTYGISYNYIYRYHPVVLSAQIATARAGFSNKDIIRIRSMGAKDKAEAARLYELAKKLQAGDLDEPGPEAREAARAIAASLGRIYDSCPPAARLLDRHYDKYAGQLKAGVKPMNIDHISPRGSERKRYAGRLVVAADLPPEAEEAAAVLYNEFTSIKSVNGRMRVELDGEEFKTLEEAKMRRGVPDRKAGEPQKVLFNEEFKKTAPGYTEFVNKTSHMWCPHGFDENVNHVACFGGYENIPDHFIYDSCDRVATKIGNAAGWCNTATGRVHMTRERVKGAEEDYNLSVRLYKRAWGGNEPKDADRLIMERMHSTFSGQVLVHEVGHANATRAQIGDKAGGSVWRKPAYSDPEKQQRALDAGKEFGAMWKVANDDRSKFKRLLSVHGDYGFENPAEFWAVVSEAYVFSPEKFQANDYTRRLRAVVRDMYDGWEAPK